MTRVPIAPLLAASLIFGLTGAAVSGERGYNCATSGEGRSVDADALRQRFQELGYRIDRIKAKHGCLSVRAANESGYPIKATFDRAGELIYAKLR